MGLHWADRADPSWQHFKDHLTGPQRGNVFGFGCVGLCVGRLRRPSFYFFVSSGVVSFSDQYPADKRNQLTPV